LLLCGFAAAVQLNPSADQKNLAEAEESSTFMLPVNLAELSNDEKTIKSLAEVEASPAGIVLY
jgi:hypothetical protein